MPALTPYPSPKGRGSMSAHRRLCYTCLDGTVVSAVGNRASCLGLLVGLQREHAASGMAGMRTFPLITVFGSVSAVLANHFHESWIVAAGLLAIVAVTVVGHLFRPQPNGRRGCRAQIGPSPFPNPIRAPPPTWPCC